MKTLVLVFASTALFALQAQTNDLETLKAKIAAEHAVKQVDRFYDYDRVVFDFEGYKAWVVCPRGETKPGCPWTWTMQWATAYVPRTNVPLMLGEGWHHATIETFERRMDEEGLRVSARYQKFLVEKLGFSPKACLIGMSWGGFYSVRYAATYPQNVAKIYLDCPLVNFYGFAPDGSAASGAKRIGPWQAVAPADGNWFDDPRMPINVFQPIVEAKIPVLLLYGGQDGTLNPNLNARLFASRFRKAGGDITVKCRDLYGHHPHGVEVNETTIRDFFER